MLSEVYDIESLYNCFTYTGYCRQTQEFHQFVIHDSRNEIVELYNHLFRDELIMIGFNNISYDYPVLHNIIKHYEEYIRMSGLEIALKIYDKSQEIIGMEFSAIATKNMYIPQIDLFRIHHFNNKARATSLKALQINMCMPLVADMPIHHNSYVHPSDIQTILDYNKNDVIATNAFLDITVGKTDHLLYQGDDMIKLRQQLTKMFNVDVMNLGDVPMGDELMLYGYSRLTGISIWDLKKKKTIRGDIPLKDAIPHWADIRSPEFKSFYDKLNNTVLRKTYNNQTGTYEYEDFKYSVVFHNILVDFGIGGIHACTKQGVYKAKPEQIIIDLDVASLYPSLAVTLGLYPEHLGPEFRDFYANFVLTRLIEKSKPKEERNMVLIKGYKLICNGIYGKSGEETSWLYDKLYQLRTTIAGQLFVAMWAERLVEVIPNVKFLQKNTDGISIIVNKEDEWLVDQVNNDLTLLTGLTIEKNYYNQMIIKDVNNYLAQYIDGYIKYKGCFEIDKELHKDGSMRIVPIAVKKYFIDGIDPRETIENHKNIYDFCLRMKVNATSTGTITHIETLGEIETTPLSKNTRYYISNRGGQLNKQFSKKRKSGVNVGYAVTIFNEYVEKKDYDINYDFYVAEAYKIIYATENNQLTLF